MSTPSPCASLSHILCLIVQHDRPKREPSHGSESESGNNGVRSDRVAVGRLSVVVPLSNTKAVVGRRLGMRRLCLCHHLFDGNMVGSSVSYITRFALRRTDLTQSPGKPTSMVGLWMFVRHSTLLLVARIIYPSLKLRRMVYGIASVFFLSYISFMAAKLWYYCHDLSWMNNTLYFGNALLPLSTNLIIFELTTDFITDAILISLPIKLLWSVKLPTRQRRMIVLIFASGITVTLAATCRATCQILELNSIVSLMMDAELSISFVPRSHSLASCAIYLFS
ncbi:hypothetical protein EDD16DRAFT_993309 [Pisolithus croceorrhizus]|nr:hypothetical protein EDD16DRAFT_993309 [Pisolithus croceorrhizus]